jgi:hypothetical protein
MEWIDFMDSLIQNKTFETENVLTQIKKCVEEERLGGKPC